ncbi:MAG: D-tyrosyl-tRNA(Tyr) deacylase [Proteobacteria bacterium]|nr:D-tyrosyl-tRNA(Tyr) deacylase [Pseudomonadota bacterium]
MIALLQRVQSASVVVEENTVASIGFGLLVYAAVQQDDDEHTLSRMADKVLAYRLFDDGSGRMNQSVVDVQGEVLLVPQFTLAADTRKGLRASFSNAAEPSRAAGLFDRFADNLKINCAKVQTGIFGACMQVHSVNDGPVTFWLEV